MSSKIIDIELAPCPLCKGNDVVLYDCTDNEYGFMDYMIKCTCGLRFYSKSTSEHYFADNKYHTPQTEESKKKAYDKMIQDWNRR